MAFQQVRYRCTMIKHKIFHKLQTYYHYCMMHHRHSLQKRHKICEIVDFEVFKGFEVSNIFSSIFHVKVPVPVQVQYHHSYTVLRDDKQTEVLQIKQNH